MDMADRPIVLVHGYSATGAGFQTWSDRLQRAGGYSADEIDICTYISLNNDISIHDIAEAFNRALRHRWPDETQEFDAIVHSTGMLVVRAWLTLYPKQRGRLKHLIGIAPASFGSPLAHMGRSFVGALIEGNKDILAPDFLQSGTEVLDALELGSKFTWDLAEKDLLGSTPFYGQGPDTPWVFILCGDSPYPGWQQFVNMPGTDGTVRWAGTALNTRKIVVNLVADPDVPAIERLTVVPWSNYNIPVHVRHGYNHSTIQSAPADDLVQLVLDALKVTTWEQYSAWDRQTTQSDVPLENLPGQYQQFIVRAVDERGDGIADYNLQLLRHDTGEAVPIMDINTDPHVYSTDPSYRCFQVDVRDLKNVGEQDVTLRITASSGSQLVGYRGFAGMGGGAGGGASGNAPSPDKFEGEIPLGDFAALQRQRNPDQAPIALFAPLTTTLIELVLTREAIPFDPLLPNSVCWFPSAGTNLLTEYSTATGFGFTEERLEQAAEGIVNGISDKLTGATPQELSDAVKKVILGELKSRFL
jgi:pimeloyl-ACP methyl ester carboxylesterase